MKRFYPFLAALLALGLCFGGAAFAASFVSSELVQRVLPAAQQYPATIVVWVGAILVALLVYRPFENFVRRRGYGLASVESVIGRDGEDQISDAAEQALLEAYLKELGKAGGAERVNPEAER